MLIITVNADESRRRTFSSFVENNSALHDEYRSDCGRKES